MKGSALFILSTFVLLLGPRLLHSYDLVLKNGKTVHGTLINETDDLIILRDTSGVQVNFKKSAVDLEKTTSMNTPARAPVSAPATDKNPATPASSQPVPTMKKKPSRVVTEKDLERLREKYDLGAGLYRAGQTDSSETTVEQKEQKSEEEWRSEAQQMTTQVQEAEQIYNQRKQQCDRLKNVTVQTNTLIDGKTGHQLPIAETREEMCSQADDAREAYEGAKQDYKDFMESARQENVPPGYLMTDPEYQENLEREQN